MFVCSYPNVLALPAPSTGKENSLEGGLCIVWLIFDVARSSGLTSDGASVNSTTSRQVACPPGETNITDVVLNSVGSVLYSAAGNTVRIWDLRMYDSKLFCIQFIFC